MTTSPKIQERVFIVDDESSNVRLLERILEMSGTPQVKSTTDPRLAVQMCREFQPDLVVLDLHMPHLDGFAVMEQLYAGPLSDGTVPILILTADISVETKRRALLAGAKDFVSKPLDYSEVVLRIRNLLENRFLHREMQAQNLMLEQQVRERTASLEQALSELRSTQEQVIRQERLRALGLMSGGIAHDFNNALTMILGYGELLFPWLQLMAPPRQIGFLQNMVSAAQDAAQVVSRLREFYRPAASNEPRVALDLNSVIDQTIRLTEPKWKGASRARGVQIAIETDFHTIPPVAGNAAEIREVLANLIFNAVDAMPDGGTIIIATVADDSGVMIAVTDTGIGMNETECERCLEPFFTTKGEHGTGLGLAVVYGIVQRHAGSINVLSKRNHGTTFSIQFPATMPTEPQTPRPAETLDRALRILVVDDQEIIGELLAEYLKGDGHATACAANGRQALEMFGAQPFDLIITDQSMPGMNGAQLARAIKGVSPLTPVILITGFGDEMLASGERPADVDLVLGKPVGTAELRKAICQLMAKESSIATAN